MPFTSRPETKVERDSDMIALASVAVAQVAFFVLLAVGVVPEISLGVTLVGVLAANHLGMRALEREYGSDSDGDA